MQITFHGAACNVTGSKHLIDHEGQRLLLDCGFFQGKRTEARHTNSGFPFPASSIDAVVLSHAHLDHCGMLPLLVKQGFKGKIFSTPATKDVAQKMLMDSAAIQESDHRYIKRKATAVSHEKMSRPLYVKNDIAPTMRKFVTHNYVRQGGGWLEVLPGIRLKFYDAGHILGSAVSVLEFKKGIKTKKLAFTGDLGRANTPILHDPQTPKEKIDLLISEATYGNRIHGSSDEAYNKLKDLVQQVAKRRSKLIVPAFSLGRTQEFVYMMHLLTDAGEIPRIPIYVDSPLSLIHI